MSLLEQIIDTKHHTPPRIVLHGPPKVGKSTFAASMPDPIILQTEDGLAGIEAKAFPLAESYNDILLQIEALCKEEHQYKTVVLDSADWLEKLIHEHICASENVATIELAAGGYGKGYMLALTHTQTVLRGLNYLNKTQNMLVCVICHSRIRTINDPLNEAYDSYQMKLHSPKSGNGVCELFKEWADILGFADTETFVKRTSGNDKIESRKAWTTQKRLLYVNPNPAYAAGNRYGVNGPIELSWPALQQAIIDADQGESNG